MTPRSLHRVRARHLLAGALVFYGLFLASRWNFLLFHGIAEMFSVSVAGTVFMVSWNTRRQQEDAYFSFLGIGLLFVAFLDLLHLLAYKGMGVFPGNGANLPTQLWIANRYLFAISFLAAPGFAGRRLQHGITFAAFAAATACLLASIFIWKIFPDCFIEGVGLTPFKIASEYVISGIFLASIAFLMRKKESFDSPVLHLLVSAAAIAVASEMAFTLYTDVYGLSNLIGHFLEILSFFLIYQAVIGTDLVRKYELNRRLQEELAERQRAQEEVRKAKERLEERVARRTAELSNLARRLQDELESRQKAEEGLARQTDLLESVLDSVGEGVVVADREGKFLVFNPEAERLLHLGATDSGQDQWAERYGIYLPDAATLCPTEQLPMVRAIRGESFDEQELFIRYGPGPEGVWVSCSARPLLRRDGQVQGGVVAFRDISARKRGEKALRDSTELLEKVFSNIHLSVVYLDRDFRFLRVNQAYADACGHPPEFFTGKNHFDLYPHEENEGIFRKVVETGEPFNVYAKPFTHPDRPERGVTYWDWSLLPLKEPDGRVNGLIFCLVDVTDRRQAEMELRALNRTLGEVSDTLRGVIQASPLPVLLLDSEGKVKIWNPAAERVFGWTLHEVLGRALPIVPEDRKEEFLDILVRSRQGESFSNLEVQRVRKDGSRLDVLVSTAPLRDPEGTYLGNIAMLVDITDRKRIENALRESEERFRDLVEQSPVGIFIVQEGRIVFRNPEQRRLFGPMPENLELKAFRDIHPEDAAKFGELCSAVATGGNRTQEMDLRFYPYGRAHDGVDMRWVHVITGPLEYRGKEAALVIMADITRLKEMEYQFLVREKMASLGHVAAGIAHEIRNPLSGINIHLSALEKALEDDGELRADTREQSGRIIGQIKSASGRIESVIKKVMDFSRPGAPRMERTDLNLAIEEAIDFSATFLRRSGVTLDRANLTPLPKCPANASLITQVVMNLITNAAQAMEHQAAPKMLSVETRVEKGYAVISVSDSGPGIPPAIRTKIFDPFFTTRRDGFGIGLSLCHRIITDHRGTIRVETSRWGGTEFRIDLPIESKLPVDVN